MMRTNGSLFVAAILAGLPLAAVAENAGKGKTYNFDQDSLGKAPVALAVARTANVGKPPKWIVEAHKDAPSGSQALAQIDADETNARYPLAVTTDDAPADVLVSVKCKAVAGKVDQACGIVFRYKDPNNYYVARSNVLEDNVRLYYVKNGKRTQIATWDGKVPSQSWNELAGEAKGDVLRVYFNGKKVIEQKDKTFTSGGKVGLWTKADSITYFDDLTVTAPRGEK